MVIGGYSIGEYWCFLIVIILVVIGGYFIGEYLTRSQVTGVKPQVRVSQSQVVELKLGSTLPTPNSRKG